MDYNTTRPRLIMSEYGRNIQQMVEHCKTIEKREERNVCAKTIIRTMEMAVDKEENGDDIITKLWNHLAFISNYELDIDYPVEIERNNDTIKRQPLSYPQQNIKFRHYGATVEKFMSHLNSMDSTQERDELSILVANHMKRDLSNWNVDIMSDRKVADDIANYTGGKVTIDPASHPLTSDGELLSSRISTSVKKRKKK